MASKAGESVSADDAHVLGALRQVAGANPTGQRHEPRWAHPFAARMPLSVAEHFIRATTMPEAVVLDPMVGSGTTAVAARRLGRRALGIDRDPLALLISRCVTTNLDFERAIGVSERVLQRALMLTKRVGVPRGASEKTACFIEYWFPLESQRQLAALAGAIRKEPPGPGRDLAWLVFSSLIIAKSAGASWAMDISRSRPHKREDKGVVLPFDAWRQRFGTAAARLPFRDGCRAREARILGGDARALPLRADSVDLVLTSPPYLSAIDYLRAHRFSLVWMGYSTEAVRELRATMIGTERGLWSPDGLPPPVEGRLARVVQPERLRAQRRQYLSDLKKALAEVGRVLRPGGLAIVAVGPRILSVTSDDAAPVVEALAAVSGLKKVGRVTRHLKAADRSLPFLGRGVGKVLAKRMCAEVFVALRKGP